MLVHAEYTTTFGGEPNYSWVNRVKVEARTERGAVRKVKEKFGLTGVPCKRVDMGDTIALYPRAEGTVVFIDFQYFD